MMAGVFVCFTHRFCLQQPEQCLAPSKCSANEWILRKWFYSPELELGEAVEKIFWNQAFVFFSSKTFLSWSYPKKLHGPKLAILRVCYDPSVTVEDAVSVLSRLALLRPVPWRGLLRTFSSFGLIQPRCWFREPCPVALPWACFIQSRLILCRSLSGSSASARGVSVLLSADVVTVACGCTLTVSTSEPSLTAPPSITPSLATHYITNFMEGKQCSWGCYSSRDSKIPQLSVCVRIHPGGLAHSGLREIAASELSIVFFSCPRWMAWETSLWKWYLPWGCGGCCSFAFLMAKSPTQIHNLLAVWLWAIYLTSLFLSFLIH